MWEHDQDFKAYFWSGRGTRVLSNKKIFIEPRSVTDLLEERDQRSGL